MSSPAAIILAAGSSRRLGSPKQEAVVGGKTLLERAVHTAQQANLHPVLVVVRDAASAEWVRVLGAEPLLNLEAAEGMASSVRCGIQAVQLLQAAGALVMTCDQPLLRPEHLSALCREPTEVRASAYGGRKGVPAYFPAKAYPALLLLTGDVGARELLQVAAAVENESLALDIDTAGDLQHAREQFGL